MISRLSLFALLAASVFCYESEIMDTLRDAGASKIAVMGVRGRLRASENYDLPNKDRKAITEAFANPSSALSKGLDIYHKHIHVSKANENIIEGSFTGSRFFAIKTKLVIVASVWPSSNAKSGTGVRKLADHLKSEGY